jgi:tRNA nucleotidyltransferase/poly(A) polymerase
MFTDQYLNAFDVVVRDLGVTAYLCGGTVRDLLLQRPIHDVDVVLSGRVEEVAKRFAGKMRAPYFVMDRERQVVRVVCGKGNWDLTGFRDHTIEGDLEKRDFTVNALAIDWRNFYPGRSTGVILDPFLGRTDLESGILRPVTGKSLEEDPLRMVRAFRIRAELHFGLDPSVLQQIEQIHSAVSLVATERITEEMDRIFLQPDSASTWRALGETSLLGSLFPELLPMKGCEQGGYHHLDVWSHSVAALENYEVLLLSLQERFPEYGSSLSEYLDSTAGALDRRRLLKWALILHDMGKPQTRELKESGRWKFHGHEHTGGDLAQAFLKRMKFANKDMHVVSLLINQHLRPISFFNSQERSSDDFFRFFRTLGGEAVGVLLMSYGDLAAARGPLAGPNREAEFLTMLQELVRYYYQEYYPAVHTPELIKGRDLIAVLQMKPGPAMGQMLREIRELQLSGALKTRQQALEFARGWTASD